MSVANKSRMSFCNFIKENFVTLCLLSGVGSLALPSITLARPGYESLMPNPSGVPGTYCSTAACHASNRAYNNFGSDFRAAGDKMWSPALCMKDSDGDGQTNGEELGDPCCVWTGGAAARSTDISNPGINTSKALNPKSSVCSTPAPPGLDAGTPPDGAVSPSTAVDGAVDGAVGGASAPPVYDDAGVLVSSGEQNLTNAPEVQGCQVSGRFVPSEAAQILPWLSLFALGRRRRNQR